MTHADVERFLENAVHNTVVPTAKYEDYILSRRWRETALRALRRAGFRCQVCNDGECQLDVHHRTYQRLGREREMDLTVLCRDCHELFHQHRSLVSQND
jgi:5-methylcytosine-specific restriction endonuclease McrA